MTRKITLEQLQDLDREEQASMLFFLLGYCKKSPAFQKGLTAAHDEVMRQRTARAAVREAATDPEGLALVKAIHDRKAGR